MTSRFVGCGHSLVQSENWTSLMKDFELLIFTNGCSLVFNIGAKVFVGEMNSLNSVLAQGN